KDEVERVKARALRAMDRTAANSQQLAMALTETIADGDWRLYFANYDQLKRVTLDDVVRVGKLYFKDSNRTIGEFIPTAAPDRTEVPATPDLNTVFKDFKSSMAELQGEAFDPSPANIEKHITRTKLPNGMTIELLPKATRGNTASAALELRFGDEKSLLNTGAVASITGAMLMRGTKSKTRQQIQDAMDKLGATVAVGGGRGGGAASSGSVQASIQAKSENLVAALGLAVEILREPSFPEADFDQIKKQQITGIENGRTEPATLSVEALQRTLSPFSKGDIRYVRSIEERIEDIKKVTLDDVKKFHAKFYGASHADLVVVGQFNPEEVRKAAGELLGGWNNSESYARISAKYLKTTQVNLKIETPDKQNAQFEAGLRLQMSDSDRDYPAMVLANYIFGGSITGRLPDRVRNREGLSYSVNSGFGAASDGDAGVFSAAAIANPQNMPKVEASFRDELTKTLANGFTAEEVGAGKKALLDALAVQLSQDQAILARIRARDDFGRTLAWDADLNAKIGALTVDQVNAAFRKWVNPAAVSIVKAGDFKAAAVYQ
ncbi:MAG: pitrilysin family protein, partial [Terriglobia bacterium]